MPDKHTANPFFYHDDPPVPPAPLVSMLMIRQTDADHGRLARLAASEQRTLAAMARILIAEAMAARAPRRPGKGRGAVTAEDIFQVRGREAYAAHQVKPVTKARAAKLAADVAAIERKGRPKP